MSGWVSVVVLLVVVAVIALLRERWRISGIEAWAGGRGWKRREPVPAEGPQPAAALVARMTIRGARIWGLVLDGTIETLPVTFAEHESSEPGRKVGVWHTVATWPSPGATGPIVLGRGRGPKWLADAAAEVIATVREPIADAVGLPQRDDARRVETPRGWVAIGEPGLLADWLTPEKTRELDAWPHEGEFVREAGHGAWRVRGLLSVAQLQRMVEQLPAAQRLLQ